MKTKIEFGYLPYAPGHEAELGLACSKHGWVGVGQRFCCEEAKRLFHMPAFVKVTYNPELASFPTDHLPHTNC